MKRLLALHSLTCDGETVGPTDLKLMEELGTSTLGTSVRHLFERVVVIGTGKKTGGSMEVKHATGIQTRLTTSVHLEMTEEHHAEALRAVRELVILRNELVHHFLDVYNPSTAEGRLAATTFLNQACLEIGAFRDQLDEWAKAIGDAMSAAGIAAFGALEHGLLDDALKSGAVITYEVLVPKAQ